MRCGAAEILQVVVRHLMGVGAQRGELKSSLHGLKSEGIHFDWIEEIFAVLLAGEKIVDPSNESIAAELPGVAVAFDAHRFGWRQGVVAQRGGAEVRTDNAGQ